jgi:superoxide dismutase
MELAPRPLGFGPAPLKGLSERLIASHHANNYSGAVKRLNAIRSQLSALDFSSAPGFQINGLKREELIATNSMLLHELYFGSLGADGATMTPAMALALEANFGSIDRWRAEFMAMGKALGGGSGWVLLTFLPREGTLVNQWAADHTDALAGGVPILALDMYEHAYHLDYGAAAGAYVDAFMTNIDGRRSMSDIRQPCMEPASRSPPHRTTCATPRCSTCGEPACSRRPRPFSRGPSGVTLRQSGHGRTTCPRTGKSWSIASTVTKSGGRRRFGCDPPGCRPGSCAAASTPGRQRVCRLAPRAPCLETRHAIRPPRPRFDIWSGS